jgi:hypothetical protein
MPSPRVGRLYAAIAAAGVSIIGLGLILAARDVRVSAPSVADIASACSRWALPDPSLSSVALLALGSVGLASVLRGGWSAARHVRDASRAGRRVLRRAVPSECHPGVLVIDDRRLQAFCIGLLRPRVVVSRPVLALPPVQVDAVLAHEFAHRDRRDPLRLLLARTVADALFFLPVLRALGRRYEDALELAADRHAVAATGAAAPLAAALLSFESVPVGGVGIAPERVDQLYGELPRWQLPVALLAWAAAALTALGALAWRAGHTGSPMPVDLPAVLGQLCMVAMVAAPVLVGAAGALSLRRTIADQR